MSRLLCLDSWYEYVRHCQTLEHAARARNPWSLTFEATGLLQCCQLGQSHSNNLVGVTPCDYHLAATIESSGAPRHAGLGPGEPALPKV